MDCLDEVSDSDYDESSYMSVQTSSGKTFLEVMVDENIMSERFACMIRVCTNRFTQLFHAVNTILWMVAFFLPHHIWTVTYSHLPGLTKVVSLVLFASSLFSMGSLEAARRLRTSEDFKAIACNLETLQKLKASNSLTANFHPTLRYWILWYLVSLGFVLLPVWMVEGSSSGYTILITMLCIVTAMTQEFMCKAVVDLYEFAMLVPRLQVQVFIEALQKQRNHIVSAAHSDRIFSYWRDALRKFKALETNVNKYYMAIGPLLLTQLVKTSMLFLCGSSFVYGGVSRMSEVLYMNLSVGVLGVSLCCLCAWSLKMSFANMAEVTTLYSGRHILAEERPTVLSCAYGFMVEEGLTESARFDLDRFVAYVKESNSGAHMLGLVRIDSTVLLKFTAFITVFMWLVKKMVELFQSDDLLSFDM